MRQFFILILLFCFCKAYSCSCNLPPTEMNDEQYNSYGVIAKGKVVRVKTSYFRDRKVTYLKIETLYKGEVKHRIIKIYSSAQGCAMETDKGEEWLIFAYTDKDRVYSNLCTLSKNLNPHSWHYNKEATEADFAYLDKKVVNQYNRHRSNP